MTRKIVKQFSKSANRKSAAINLPKVCFINTYFGKLPIWTPLFLESCQRNPTFSWLIIASDQSPKKLPKNVKFVKMSLEDFNKLAKKQTGLPFSIKTPYKICDAKPMYGEIFKDFIKGFTFWGASDLDVIYGDLESFDIRSKLINCDIYSPFDSPVGHFTLYRNVEAVNKLYQKFENLHLAYQDGPSPFGFDERFLQKTISLNNKIRLLNTNYKNELLKNRCETGASIMPSGQLVGELFSAQESYLYKNGKTFQLNGKRRREFLYIHFFCWKSDNFWKRYRPTNQPLIKYWLDLSGFTSTQKDLLKTDYLSRLTRYSERSAKLIIRAKKRLLF